MLAAMEVLGAVEDAGEAEMQRSEARVLATETRGRGG
jgi:hypothetical protein